MNTEEIGAHELGHAVDFVNSYANSGNYESTNSTYLSYVADDFMYLDYTYVAPNSQTGTERDPCIGASAPFAGIIDEMTGKLFCVSTQITGYTEIPSGAYLESQYVSGGLPLMNSQIAQRAFHDFMWDSTLGWGETYAQVFAWQAYVGGLNPSQYAYAVDVILNTSASGDPYFSCAKPWAAADIQTTTVPPPTAPAPYSSLNGFPACDQVQTIGPYAWYRQLLGH
jgi:hypothetical protein